MSLTISQLCDELAKAMSLTRPANDVAGQIDPGSFVPVSFSTDTRTLVEGAVFIALKGPNHDAHDHAHKAVSAGASVLVVERQLELPVAQIIVENTLDALGAIAGIWCQAHTAERIAVTGSNGKTTVKEMVAAILRVAANRASGKPADNEEAVVATRGNFNNEIGLPLTCLAIRNEHRYAVLEMGASASGEISYLSRIARPSVALVNSIAAAHLEGFGSLHSIAREKSSIYSGLDANGVAVMPIELVQHPEYGDLLVKASAHCRQRTFGFSPDADISATRSEQDASATHVKIDATVKSSLAGADFEFKLQLLGRHNHMNALAAIAVCSCFDITTQDIVEGLANVAAVPGRLQLRLTSSRARIIDDTYNANPASFKVAVDVLAGFSGKRVLVLGDMKELGPDEMQLHADAGRYAKSRGIDCLITIGALAALAASEFGENASSFSEKKDIAWLLKEKLGPEHTVLFKGSRGARVEEIIDLMQEAGGDSGDAGSGKPVPAGSTANKGSKATPARNNDPYHRTPSQVSQRLLSRVVCL